MVPEMELGGFDFHYTDVNLLYTVGILHLPTTYITLTYKEGFLTSLI